jgi:hypothetical protein
MFLHEGRDSKIPESDIKGRVIGELEPKIKLLASLIWICISSETGLPNYSVHSRRGIK